MLIRQYLGVVASLVPLLLTPLARGQRYFVAPYGSDQASGSRSAPFRTIQRAAQVAGPGDTVIVRAGTYTGKDRMVSLTRSGRPAAWITFRSETQWKAVLDGRQGRSQEAWYFGPGVSYIRIEGFEIHDLHQHGFDFYGGGVHDIVIARNRVHDIGRNCTDTQNGRTGASLGNGASRVSFDGNVWSNIGRLAPGENGCTPATLYYQNHDHGIYVADANDISIINNLFYSFGRGWAVHRYSSAGVVSRGLLIANNTFTGANSYRPGQIIVATPTAGLRIENNIFSAPTEAGLYFEDVNCEAGVVRYNLVSGGALKVGDPTGVSFSHNWEGGDPRFVSSTDLQLQADSPAIDAGVLLPEVTHDARGIPRPQGDGVDLGAYER
jgi:hypothetical protein